MSRLKNSVEGIVAPGMLNETRELNIKQRKNRKMSVADKFFEKTSTLGIAATEVPIFLVKEFSLARINAYFNILGFGIATLWSFKQIKENLNNFFQMIFPIMIAVLSIYKIFQSLMILSQVYSTTKKIRNNKTGNYKNVPIFITQIYRQLILKRVDINWFGFLYYIFGGLYLWIPKLLHGKSILLFKKIDFNFTGIDQPFSVYNIVKYTIVVMMIVHALYLLWTKHRINVINAFYEHEIVPRIEQDGLIKTRHARWRRGLIIAALIIFIVPYLLYRWGRNKGVLK